jgi:hypothetical protein
MVLKCAAKGCGKPVKARGWCSTHYAFQRRRGNLQGAAICAVEGCGKSLEAKGWCKAHYMRWQRYGTPLGGEAAEPGKLWAWLLVHRSFSGDHCLIWPFSRHQKGYPSQLTISGLNHRERATRVMCALVHGPAPTTKHQAAHSCHNGHLGCVHPQHLHWATGAENAAEGKRAA